MYTRLMSVANEVGAAKTIQLPKQSSNNRFSERSTYKCDIDRQMMHN